MNHREAAEEVARRLHDEVGDALVRVILHGSVVREEERPDSDVDLVVVARDFRLVYRALRPILGELMAKGAPSVSAMVFTEDEFQQFPHRSTPFYRAVLSEGETLVA